MEQRAAGRTKRLTEWCSHGCSINYHGFSMSINMFHGDLLTIFRQPTNFDACDRWSFARFHEQSWSPTMERCTPGHWLLWQSNFVGVAIAYSPRWYSGHRLAGSILPRSRSLPCGPDMWLFPSVFKQRSPSPRGEIPLLNTWSYFLQRQTTNLVSFFMDKLVCIHEQMCTHTVYIHVYLFMQSHHKLIYYQVWLSVLSGPKRPKHIKNRNSWMKLPAHHGHLACNPLWFDGSWWLIEVSNS